MGKRVKKIFIINGPNLNLLGIREPEIYGIENLQQINRRIKKFAKSKKIGVRFFQSNHEGRIIDRIHRILKQRYNGLIINPGAFTHYSFAIRDAIKAVSIPTVEVHISDIHGREKFRNESVIKDVCIDQISGKGIDGYFEALELLCD